MPEGRDSRIALAQGAALLVVLGFDALGEPPSAWHPVVWFGKLIRFLERASPRGRVPELVYGVAMLLLAAPCAFLPALLLHRVAVRVYQELLERNRPVTGFVFFILLEGMGLKPFFSLRMLVEAGRSVRLALERRDLSAAREELLQLVSRDRLQLTEEQAGAAAIELLAENLSDFVVAPLMYYLLLGLPGAAVYRLFNTFDSMIGYHGKYEYLGKAAARLDDLLNLLPSRVTALLIFITAPLWGGERRNAWRIWRRDARKTASPNAGHPMAMAAGALSLRLEKIDHYALGDNNQPITPARIRQAERMVWTIGGLVFGLAALSQFLRGCSLCKK